MRIAHFATMCTQCRQGSASGPPLLFTRVVAGLLYFRSVIPRHTRYPLRRRSYDRLFMTLGYFLVYVVILFMQKDKTNLFRVRKQSFSFPSRPQTPQADAHSCLYASYAQRVSHLKAAPPPTLASRRQIWESVMSLSPASNSPTMVNPAYNIQVNGPADIYSWLTGILFPAWNDPSCGDISCIAPYEFPSFGAESAAAGSRMLTDSKQPVFGRRPARKRRGWRDARAALCHPCDAPLNEATRPQGVN